MRFSPATIYFPFFIVTCNSIAFRKAKIAYNFGLSECNIGSKKKKKKKKKKNRGKMKKKYGRIKHALENASKLYFSLHSIFQLLGISDIADSREVIKHFMFDHCYDCMAGDTSSFSPLKHAVSQMYEKRKCV